MENKRDLYESINYIQTTIESLNKSGINSMYARGGNKGEYFMEKDALQVLRPLLKQEQITIITSWDYADIIFNETIKEYIVKGMFIVELIKGDDRYSTKWVASGIDRDPSKAIGKAETYRTKYFLTKLFLIPTNELDPDNEEFNKKESKQEKEFDEKGSLVAKLMVSKKFKELFTIKYPNSDMREHLSNLSQDKLEEFVKRIKE